MDIEALFTEEIAATPYDMIVKDFNNEHTGETMQIITLKSRAFMEANQNYLIRTGKTGLSNPDVVQSLISGWSFENDCSKENKIRLLENAPYLIDQIIGFSHAKTEELFSKKKT